MDENSPLAVVAKICLLQKWFGIEYVDAENTHCREWFHQSSLEGEHHCMAGLQFYKVALDCFTKYK